MDIDLKSFREKNKLSQTKFAKLIGIPRQTYQFYEYGLRTPVNSNMIKIEKAIKEIEEEKNSQERIRKYMEAAEKYDEANKYWQEHEDIDDEFHENKNKIKYLILLIILISIFAVVW